MYTPINTGHTLVRRREFLGHSYGPQWHTQAGSVLLGEFRSSKKVLNPHVLGGLSE